MRMCDSANIYRLGTTENSGVGRSLKVGGGGGGGGGANYDGCEGLINNLGRYSNS